ncbi:MAG: RagB/SusD family nutrient uptake outer membrane protein [Bacteroidota bacterium]
MKNKILISIATIALLLTISYACKETFLEQVPTGSMNNVVLATEKGVNGLLVGAYAAIMEHTTGIWGAVADGPENWVFGGICSDEATKGMRSSNESAVNSLENSTVTPTNSYCQNKWMFCYDGIARANDVLKVLAVCNPAHPDADNIKAQALFLRGYFHIQLKKIFNMIPYITESVDPPKVKNDVDTWPLIEADLKFAMENLPPSQADPGRATKWSAMAFLAKVYMFQKKWPEAKTLLDDIIANSGKSLMPNYWDNFDITNRHNNEALFEIQASVNDGAQNSSNANYSDWGINPAGGYDGVVSCCGAYQPTQNLVNAYQVDAQGLPILTGTVPEFINDMGLSSSQTFVQDTITPVDPRLDYVVGRRGVPYYDYGIMRGSEWIGDQAYGGPYNGKKGFLSKADADAGYITNTGWASGVNAHIYKPIRYAHILLWRAEVAAETGDFVTATTLVNQIRERASHQKVMGRCRTFELLDQTSLNVDYTVPAANYKINQYTSNFPNIDYARKAIQMENRLEFAMEGHRHFDLVRWGIAAETINAYYEQDRGFRYLFTGTTPAHFTAGRNEYFPIPQTQIDIQKGVLTQIPGYGGN